MPADNQTVSWPDGVRAVSPILLSVMPFGLVFGVTAVAADVPVLAAWASSVIIFAGASQIAIVEILGNDGAAAVALLTAIVINARMMMYSADMGRYTVAESWPRKLSIAYLLTDQAYLVTAHRFPEPKKAVGAIPFYFGAGLALWLTWQTSTTAGMLLGSAVPESWSLEFAIPLTFMALLVLAIRDKPGAVAAVVGGAVALAGVALPYNLGLPLGALVGVAAAMASERWLS
ncbi:MAG: AzlC family ABC transporter permease [Acidimicrobiia bacterium]